MNSHTFSRSFSLVVASMSLIAVNANAAYYSYSQDNPAGRHDAGLVSSLEMTYSQEREAFSWSHTISDTPSGQSSDGFWLVISDGPTPKTHAGEYAILYGDVSANTLTGYEYSGQNNSLSWTAPGHYLGSWALDVSRNVDDSQSILSFALNTSTVNGSYTGPCSVISGNCDSDTTEWQADMWDGVQFNESMGYWLHPFVGGEFAYDVAGRITNFSFEEQSVYDAKNLTTSVSGPSTLPILMMAIGVVVFYRKRMQSKSL